MDIKSLTAENVTTAFENAGATWEQSARAGTIANRVVSLAEQSAATVEGRKGIANTFDFIRDHVFREDGHRQGEASLAVQPGNCRACRRRV